MGVGGSRRRANPSSPPVCSSEPENVQAVPHNRSSLLLMWERPRAVYDAAIDKYSVSYTPAGAEQATPSVYLTDGDQDVVRGHMTHLSHERWRGGGGLVVAGVMPSLSTRGRYSATC